MTEFEKLKAFILDIEASGDVNKVYNKGMYAPGVRLRKNMQKVKELAQSVRDEVSSLNHAQITKKIKK
jgi:hypothetical protein